MPRGPAVALSIIFDGVEMNVAVPTDWQTDLNNNGFALIRNVYGAPEMRETIVSLDTALAGIAEGSASIRSRKGRVYAARNFLELFPGAREIWRCPRLMEVLQAALGGEAGLVRALYFDKPPDQSWSLPWHRDLTIAVQNNALATREFCNPTKKAGVAHVEASRRVLAAMLTVRIHLDPADEENGALQVLPGSHHEETVANGQTASKSQEATVITAARGDVLLMRPLLSHCSGNSLAGSTRHRRVIHLEFAANEQLPDGFAWRWFEPIVRSQ